MSIKKVISGLDFSLSKEEGNHLKKRAKEILEVLNEEINKRKIDADVFLGGSFAKGTLMKSSEYDVDIFVRFDWRYENLSEPLERIVNSVSKKLKMKSERIHGSRDYFRINEGNIAFEIIPVTKISKPKEARNVTDLSYFHVSYVKRKVNDKIKKEILLAKAFAKAQEAYGAESYIGGFSGYAIECLIIYYKSFEKMLKAIADSERIIIDPEKQYKKKDEIILGMNESRLKSPVVIVDPIWRERNVTAALTNEIYDSFREKVKKFIKKPSKQFFEVKLFDELSFRNKALKFGEYLRLKFKTNKQSGDIAGTKMKKFSKFIQRELAKYFEIGDSRFEYEFGQTAELHLSLCPRKEIMIFGPPVEMEDAVSKFKKAHPRAFEKKGKVCAVEKVNYKSEEFVKEFRNKYDKTIKSMDIIEIGISSV